MCQLVTQTDTLFLKSKSLKVFFQKWNIKPITSLFTAKHTPQ